MSVAEHQAVHRFVAERFSWICAVWVHVLLFSLLLSTDRIAGPDIPASVPLAVDILPFREFARTVAPPPALAPIPPSADRSEGAASEPQDNPVQGANLQQPDENWHLATAYYAKSVLSDPRSAQARLALTTLVSGDRREQLCALEAMEQVRHAHPNFRPTRLAPHAFRNSIQRKNVITAPAAALRSNRIWYEIAYKCRLSESVSDIVGFEFALGEAIDRSLWDEHGLAPVH
ncbi:DUF930 domain-containing protein [Roseibium sp. MMSF_3544]|uniref:DUF930 domain-containing protein n=1 Tax=unclassified Roseibium TaxID=2629323 RepID=UPI00273D6AEA|nr:DUF930 domain-containing protein [Roseibium sp. MMSF_3544]